MARATVAQFLSMLDNPAWPGRQRLPRIKREPAIDSAVQAANWLLCRSKTEDRSLKRAAFCGLTASGPHQANEAGGQELLATTRTATALEVVVIVG